MVGSKPIHLALVMPTIKIYSKVYKSKRKKGVTFVQVAVYKIKEASKAISGGGGLHVPKLLWIFGCFNV